MDVFREDGHLTDEALEALAQEEAPDGLARLEIAEHLAFCDACLQRYTAILAGAQLLAPEHSCQGSIWGRIQMRALRLVTSRYAAAAAAVGLALTVVWGGGNPVRRLPEPPRQRQYVVSESLRQWSADLDGAMRDLNDILDGLNAPARQGGDHS